MTSDVAPVRRAFPALTKIVATLGPASCDDATLRRLVAGGVDVFRLNFSHGDAAWHAEAVQRVREVAGAAGLPIGILGDLPGPKIRVGEVVDGGVEVAAGDRVVMQREPIVAGAEETRPLRLSSTHERLLDDLEAGQRLLIDDGRVRMLAIEGSATEIVLRVTAGGCITSAKGINLPDTALRMPAMTTRDWEWVDFALDHGLDFVALSFVRHVEDLHALRAGLAERARDGEPPHIVSKIERPEAVDRIDAIVEASDAVMVARGDLGVEMDIARVPVIQRHVMETSRRHGTPCIVATQMLESMISAPAPTRAEASDVANAIFLATDAVMLSGETAIGQFPALTVETMYRIAIETERSIAEFVQPHAVPPKLAGDRTAALSDGVWTVSKNVGARIIVVWSQSGGGARILSQTGFSIPIIAVSTSERALRRMQLLRGVMPIHMDLPRDLDEFTRRVDAFLLQSRWGRAGDRIVLVGGEPLGTPKVTNRLAVHTIGDDRTGFRHVPSSG